MSNQHVDSGKNDYIKGFIASLILTIIPFYFVATQSLPETVTYALMFGCAIVQVFVHFVYFLHMETIHPFPRILNSMSSSETPMQTILSVRVRTSSLSSWLSFMW